MEAEAALGELDRLTRCFSEAGELSGCLDGT